MKKLLAAGLLISLSIYAKSQETRFFMASEIKNAYKNDTRSFDGKPGPNYWQNTVDYNINVGVTPETRQLEGSETVVFNNNSPDDLRILVVRLYHDVFRKANQRAMRVREGDVNDGVELTKLAINGDSVNMDEDVSRQGTNMIISLNEPIRSGTSATIEIDWKHVIPETTRRTGAYDSTSFFVSYWYPQVAVYDDVFGWDLLSYDFSTEFYNNLGNFDVTITAPENFTVIATGELQNPEEIFESEKLALYNRAKNSSETVQIISEEDVNNGYRHRTGSWNYKASEVTDFSFCLSDHFMWDAAIQKVEDRDVLIHTYYNVNVAERAGELTAIQQKTMKHFSEDVPGIPYPYPEFATCVMGVGGGGMETPMMANNGQPGRGVTIHEMFHTYFPMYVRINEKRFAWMDEGWANFNTTYLTERFFEENDDLLIDDFASLASTLGTISDLPLITSTQFMDNSNYGYASYPLPEFMYFILHHHLGEELFRKCYSTYIADWAQKSPTPYDFFYTFERVSGQDLGWFWKPWFFNFGNVDIAIANFEKGKLEVSNTGTRPVPVTISVMYNDSTTWMKDLSANVWVDKKMITQEVPDHKKIATLSVNQGIPDASILDNFFPPLKERYGDFKISDNLLGEYPLNEYPISVVFSEKDELLHVSITGTGIQGYLMPLGNDSFETLSGNMQIELTKEADMYKDITVRVFGFTLTGSKK